MPDIRVTLSIGFSNAVQESTLNIPDDEWNACETEEDRDSLLDSYWRDWASNYIDGGAWLAE